MALDFAVEGYESANSRQLASRKAFGLKVLRVETLRMLLGNPSFREFSRRAGDGPACHQRAAIAARTSAANCGTSTCGSYGLPSAASVSIGR